MRLTLLLLVTTLAACSDAATSSTTSIAPAEDPSGDWQLDAGSIDGVPIPMADGVPITLTIEGSQLSGIASCNSYRGQLGVTGGRLSLGELGMTAMDCGEAVMAAERAFVRALREVDAIHRDGTDLRLTGPGAELAFTPIVEPPVAELVGTTWLLESVFVGDVAAGPLGEAATLVLDEDGTMRGSTGCRSFTGTWTVQAHQIVAPVLAMDDRECPLDLSGQDGHVVGVIGDGFVPTLEHGLLTLTDPGGVGLVYRAEE